MKGPEARQEELWWRDNEIKEWLRVVGEKKHFKSITIRERGRGGARSKTGGAMVERQ